MVPSRSVVMRPPENLKILQLETFIGQRNVGQPHAVCKFIGEICDGGVCEEVDEDDGL